MLPYLDLHSINSPYESDIKQALLGVVDSGWYLFGSQVSSFEQEWGDYNHARHCVACANGLDALRLVLRAWIEMGRLSVGDEVIVPANTYIASILAVSDNGLVPVPVEPRFDTCLIDPSHIEEHITPRTRVILPVHLYGALCDMKVVSAIAERHGLLVLQDCAQCHGMKVSGTCAWSFYPGKNLGALGDAGAVTTDDAELAETIRRIAFYGSSRKYVHQFKGLNSRMDEFQAACLRIKLRDLDRCNVRRQQIAARYCAEISNPHVSLPVLSCFDSEGNPCQSVVHIFPVFSDHRDELQQHLLDCGIQTQIHYPIPPHRQQAYSEWNNLQLPITEHISSAELSLPCNQAMTDEQVSAVIAAVNSFRYTR